jgi:ribonuclease HI
MWVKHSDGRIIRDAWVFKDEIKDSTEAELMAIANAVYVVSRKLVIKNKIIVVVTDSQAAIQFLTKQVSYKSLNNNPSYAEICKQIRILANGATLRLKKVKAHSYKDGVRSYVNRLVDTAAKEKMLVKRRAVEVVIDAAI